MSRLTEAVIAAAEPMSFRRPRPTDSCGKRPAGPGHGPRGRGLRDTDTPDIGSESRLSHTGRAGFKALPTSDRRDGDRAWA